MHLLSIGYRRILEESTRAPPHHVAQHRTEELQYEIPQSHTAWSNIYGPEPYGAKYTICNPIVHARNDDDDL